MKMQDAEEWKLMWKKLGDENFKATILSTDCDHRLKRPEECGIFQLLWKNDNK
jgi:hypothetical protein